MTAESLPPGGAKFFVHEWGICETDAVGDGTRIWAFAHVLPGAHIGADCNINDHVFVENDVVIGNRVTVKSGVQVWDGVRLADDVVVGPNVTFTNDRFPRGKSAPDAGLMTEVGPCVSLGANSTILFGVKVGRGAMIGAGSVVTRDVPPYAIVVGNPARIVGYADSEPGSTGRGKTEVRDRNFERDLTPSHVTGVTLHRLTYAADLRGSLVAADFSTQVPFMPRRMFVVFGVPSKEGRGEHAHRRCQQFLVCVAGQVAVVADDAVHREEFLLDTPKVGLYLPPLVWGIQYKYSAEARLLVLASHEYDAADYIRDYDEFLAAVAVAEEHLGSGRRSTGHAEENAQA